MNVLFVFSLQKSIAPHRPLKGQDEIQMGISYISSLLKKHQHQTRLLVLDRRYKKNNNKLINHKIKAFNPGLICFTAVNTEFDFIIEKARYIKLQFPEIPLLLGGVHITLNPDEKFLKIFDYLCIGEGEYPVLELVGNLKNKAPVNEIKNLWIKQHNDVIKNPTRKFIQNLDNLPFPDRDIWQEWILETQSRQVILLGRGCPYNCSYCSNHKLKKVAAGKYVRLRSPENILEELTLLVKKFPDLRELFLEIETLGTNLNWLEKLCTLLANFNENHTHKIEFCANLRIYPKMNFDCFFQHLQKAGFTSVIIGLESGNERIRTEILNRKYSNETVLAAVNSARKYNLKIGIFNLIGLPTEKYQDFQDTLRLNQIIQPDWHATSIFFPYQGTKLFEMVKELNLLPEKIDTQDERQHAVLDLPGFSKKQIQKEFDNFHYNVYKKNPNKQILKLLLYYIQRFAGHNFMANAKITLIRMLYKIRIRKLNLITIFQKS